MALGGVMGMAMAGNSEGLQLISRLTPLAEVLALIERDVQPVTQRALDLSLAAGHVLAADVLASKRPSAPLALLDGWALNAEATLDAGGYAPAVLARVPPRVEVGQAMPPGTDSVAPFDAVRVADGRAEALGTVSPGDGVLPAGGDCDPAQPLRRAGERVRAVDLAAFAAAGIARITMRQPRIRIVPVHAHSMIGAAARMVAADIERHGGLARLDEAGVDFGAALAAEAGDAVIALGGTGSGRNDTSAVTLARTGKLAVHGVALTPGETAGFGWTNRRPVLLLPGRLDAALAVWLTMGRPVLARLAGVTKAAEPVPSLPLSRKVTSTVGLAEFVPVRREGDRVEPLAGKYLPLSSLTRADGWILVPAESEGYSEGAQVSVWPWP